MGSVIAQFFFFKLELLEVSRCRRDFSGNLGRFLFLKGVIINPLDLHYQLKWGVFINIVLWVIATNILLPNSLVF